MDIRFNTLPINPPRLPVETPAPGTTDAQLKQTSEDFAAMLFAQMFSAIRPKAGEGEDSLFGGEQNTELFMDMFDLKMGQAYAANGNPIAEQLYQQLKGRQSPGSQS